MNYIGFGCNIGKFWHNWAILSDLRKIKEAN
jgi:hypothetical protein